MPRLDLLEMLFSPDLPRPEPIGREHPLYGLGRAAAEAAREAAREINALGLSFPPWR